jgi:predicted ribosomally synthesized peptide with nif11-like leader
MSETAAVAFLDRLESDDDFASELESVKEDPDAVIGKVHDAGFDAEPDEILEAFTDRYGVELTPEQLDQVAAGADPGLIAGATIGGAVGTALVVAICAGV